MTVTTAPSAVAPSPTTAAASPRVMTVSPAGVLKQKVINALENLEYYDVVNENCESLEAELIADAVFEVIADYLKGGAE